MGAALGCCHGVEAQTIALRCQLQDGAWQNCLMQMQEIGKTWNIEIGKTTVLFRHDGGGTIAMKYPGQPWTAVQSHWSSETTSAQPALCWDKLCVLGPIPLD